MNYAAIAEVEKAIETIIAESIVITAAELLGKENWSLQGALHEATIRLLPYRVVSMKELVSSVCNEVGVMASAEAGYQHLKALLGGQPDMRDNGPGLPPSRETPPLPSPALTPRRPALPPKLLVSLGVGAGFVTLCSLYAWKA